jgi:hypothetical protein
MWMAEDLTYGGKSTYTWAESYSSCPDGFKRPSADDLNVLRTANLSVLNLGNNATFWTSMEANAIGGGFVWGTDGSGNWIEPVQSQGQNLHAVRCVSPVFEGGGWGPTNQ